MVMPRVLIGMLFVVMVVVPMVVLVMIIMAVLFMCSERERFNTIGRGDHRPVVVAGANQALHPALKQQAVEND